MGTIDVFIGKPLFGSKVYVWDKYIKEAIREEKMLKVSIPGHERIVHPREWVEAKDVMYKVFKDPKNPMRLFGGYVVEPKKVDHPIKSCDQLSLL